MGTGQTGSRHRGRQRRWIGGLAGLVVLTSAVSPAMAAASLELVSLSTRPDKVSGGDVLIMLRLPAGTTGASASIRLNGRDITGAFWPDPASQALIGLVTGLKAGKNTLDAKAKGAGSARLDLLDHPLAGPVFSGPQERPFFCQTHQFRPYPNGPLLTGAAIEDPCMVPTRVDHVYRSTAGAFRVLDPSAPPPADLAMTTTTDGHLVPYIVRLETGTINRAIYQTAILDDPTVAGPGLREQGDPGWNRRLVYTFGGGCGGGHYIQGASTGGVLNDMMLSRGFAVASGSLNVLGANCNDVVSAETLMMIKERFIETYGPPRYTIGWGCSGGAIQQYMITDNFPGLLDGLLPQCSFPDVYATGTFDARLLLNYFRNTAGVAWTEEELRAASGFGTFGQITNQGTSWAARIDPVPNRPGFPSAVFNAIVPPEVRYDPLANPTGVRPTTYDHNVNTFGRDGNGFARRPLDNVGVQYGLAALNAGEISPAQFLDLNEKIGGLDIDANFIPGRMVADPRATRAAYETGKITSGGGGLASVPILDLDVIYTDLAVNGDVHLKYYHFSTRERLIRASGHADNMVMWSGVTGPRQGFAAAQAFLQMDAWLAAIAADSAADPRAVKVVRNRPAGLVDGCWTGSTAPFTFIAEAQFLGGPGTSACNDLYPGFGFPRFSAGMPLSNDIVKCKLRSVDRDDYAVTFTSAEVERLHQIFPDGVCDYTRPGIDQRDLLSTWITYTDVGKYRKDKGSDGHGSH
jgi:hypothetical protein